MHIRNTDTDTIEIQRLMEYANNRDGTYEPFLFINELFRPNNKSIHILCLTIMYNTKILRLFTQFYSSTHLNSFSFKSASGCKNKIMLFTSYYIFYVFIF